LAAPAPGKRRWFRDGFVLLLCDCAVIVVLLRCYRCIIALLSLYYCAVIALMLLLWFDRENAPYRSLVVLPIIFHNTHCPVSAESLARSHALSFPDCKSAR